MALYSPPLLCYYWPVYYMYIIFLYLLSQILHYIHSILYNCFKNNKWERHAFILFHIMTKFPLLVLFYLCVCVYEFKFLSWGRMRNGVLVLLGRKPSAWELVGGVGGRRREPVFFVAAFWSGVWTLLNWDRGREKGHGSFTVRFLTGVSWIFFNRCLFICYLPLGPHPEV